MLNFSKVKKHEVEQAIIKRISQCFKDKTGKGPKQIKIHAHEGIMKIFFLDFLTPIELFYLENNPKTKLVEALRMGTFSQCYGCLPVKLRFLTGLEFELKDISLDVKENNGFFEIIAKNKHTNC